MPHRCTGGESLPADSAGWQSLSERLHSLFRCAPRCTAGFRVRPPRPAVPGTLLPSAISAARAAAFPVPRVRALHVPPAALSGRFPPPPREQTPRFPDRCGAGPAAPRLRGSGSLPARHVRRPGAESRAASEVEKVPGLLSGTPVPGCCSAAAGTAALSRAFLRCRPDAPRQSSAPDMSSAAAESLR